MERALKNTYWSGMVLAVLCLGGVRLNAATFTASLDRDTIALGESATLSLTFEDGSPRNVPMPSNVAGLQIAYVGPSSQFSYINGETKSTVTYNFTLTPRQAGDFTIPPLATDVGGQRLSSSPLSLKVLPPNSPPAAAVNSGSEVAFMRLTLPEKEVYPGEVLAARLDVYLRDDVQNFGNFQFTGTPANGFTVGKMAQSSKQRVQIGNRIYTDIPLSLALTTVKTGPVSVGPFTASAVVVLPSANQARDLFPFGIFGGGEQRQVSFATDTLNVESLPLPTEGAPPNFNGAVGDYTMTVTAGPTNVAVGDPITVRVQISGHGALDALTLPDQPAWRDFKAYPPTSKVATSDQLGLQGTKTFEQIVTPQNTDVHELPAFSFSFFNPDAKTYRTLTQPPVQLAVHSGGTTPAPMIAATKTTNMQPPPPPQDILPIKEQLGTLTQAGPPLLMQPGFLAVQSVPVLAWLAAFVWRKRTDSLANNPRLRRQRRVAQLVREGLNDLHRLAAENNSDKFFATLFRLLQEQLGERLDCPASSITEAVIDERLVPLVTPETTLAGLRELFQLCNQARYAPMRTSGELAAVIPQFENAVRELQNVKA
ncbi:MAG: BatD family protein [Verrucomicrobiota bacterium]